MVERKAAEGPLAEQKRMGAVLARVETPSLSFPNVYPPLRPGRKAKLRDPWLGPRALTSPFLPLFLQLLLKMIGLMTC